MYRVVWYWNGKECSRKHISRSSALEHIYELEKRGHKPTLHFIPDVNEG